MMNAIGWSDEVEFSEDENYVQVGAWEVRYCAEKGTGEILAQLIDNWWELFCDPDVWRERHLRPVTWKKIVGRDITRAPIKRDRRGATSPVAVPTDIMPNLMTGVGLNPGCRPTDTTFYIGFDTGIIVSRCTPQTFWTVTFDWMIPMHMPMGMDHADFLKSVHLAGMKLDAGPGTWGDWAESQ